MKTSRLLARILPVFLALQLVAAVSLAGTALRRLDLPPAVRMAIRAEASPAEIEDVTYTLDEGRPAYEVDMRRGGVERSFEVGVDGTLLSRQVFLRELSASVQQAIAQLQRFGPLGDIYWIDDDGEISYAAEITLRGAKRYFTVDLNGWLLATPLDFAQTPPAVQKAIQAQLGRGMLFTIDRVDDYSEISVQVAMLKDGRRRTFDLDPQGVLIAQQVYLDEIPQAAQAAIQQYTGSSRLAHINLSVEDGQNYYEARIVKNGVARTVTVGADGKLTSQEIDPSEAPEAVRQRLQETANGARLLKLEKVFAEASVTYEAELTANGRKISLTISEVGKVE